MFGLLLLALLALPVVELYVFVQVAGAIGFLPALAWAVALSVVGAWMVKHEGLSTLRRANDKVSRGQVPTDELANGVMILLGGALLLAPGFVTDAVGLVLVLPPTRAMLRGTVQRRFAAAGPVVITRAGFPGAFGGRTARGTGEVWDADSWETPDDPDRPELR